jgi:ribonucleoside-diphosphate reductase alpha chain
MFVTKRDGSKEELNMEKANKELEWACDGIAGVSASDIAMKAAPKLYDGVPTVEVHNSFVAAAEDLIRENYRYAEVQSRLMILDLLKRVYGDWDIIKPLSQIVQENCKAGIYDPDLYSYYTPTEWAKFDTMIDHKRDYLIMGAGMKQFTDKYLAQDRSTGKLHETPQVAYALAAIAGLARYEVNNPARRIAQVKKTYDAFSKGKVSLPTPILAGVRQRGRQFASCVLIDFGDDLQSINDGNHAAVKYAAKRAGLGINVGRIRPVGSKVNSGEVVHTGIVPYIRQIESSIKSCSQGGIRDASATLFIPIWHYEIESVLTLKSAKVSHENAVRRLDYCAQWDSFLKRRALTKDQHITLFSPHEVPDLYEAYFGKDRSIFEALYVKYEKDTSLQFRKQVNARHLFNDVFLTQASETARIYEMNVDHVNTHTPFKEPIYQSNLCVEVCLPTEPVRNVYGPVSYSADGTPASNVDYEGLIQLCILGAINLGTIDLDNTKDMEERYDVLVTYLNELIDYQEYLVPQSYKATMEYRPLGIGVVNLAYFFAKRGVKYNDQAALDLAHRLGEQMYYFGLKASCKYAAYKGKPLPAYDKLIYSDGKTLLDTYCRRVDELTKEPYHMDWQALASMIKQHGIYNSTLGAYMPSESSSTILNATSGVDPVRSLITSKKNKRISFRQVVPEPVKLKNQYDMLWDMTPDRLDGYIKVMAVLQKHCCQSISTNFSYNPDHYPDGKVEITAVMNHTFTATKYGLKTRYYVNTKGEGESDVEKLVGVERDETAEQDQAGSHEPLSNEEVDSAGCESGACAI